MKYYHIGRFLLEGVIVSGIKEAFNNKFNASTSIIKPDNLSLQVQKLV